MVNIECKYRCADLDEVARRAVAIGAVDHGHLEQQDFFFPAPHARLKVRRFGSGAGEVIAYQRDDAETARPSRYIIAPVRNAAAAVEALTLALGAPRTVTKMRHLFVFKATRIHLDRVGGLGDFVELETVVATQSPDDAANELARVAAILELTDVVPVAYVDLLP